MARFKYSAVSLDGSPLAAEAEALDEAALAADLGRRGLMLLSLDRLNSGEGHGWFASRIDQRSVTAFLGELALVLRSGLPLDEALDLAGRDLPPRLARAVSLLHSDVVGGTSFVQALQRRSDVFPDDIAGMVRVAELTGDLDGVFAAIAAERERGHLLTEKVTGALRYPAFLTLFACLVLLFFLLHVIPQFAGLFSEAGSDPGALVRSIMTLSSWLLANEDLLGLCLAGLLLCGLIGWRIATVRAAVTSGFLRLPVIRGVWMLWRTSRFLANLAVLTGQGVPINDALKVLGSVVGTDGEVAMTAVGDAVRRGGRLHEALGATGLFPPVAVRMLRIGEETGELAKVASEAAALYAKKLEKKLEQIAGLVGPIAILSIAALIGGLMATIMTALVSVNQTVM
jgi:general secretion pathway protein F